ncbi:DUF2293 domain-containing protein [Aspergillus saccharolyticus JOP 1030-1]|uniref:DUF2293 domain-containing protein n=1 Tax=Aspergillus saccharolyticus JOP 1030-1 TaxID=1450539 RepID=A0A318ZLR9_9EURO|nr:hypothetical protein BP01DRAFT_313665 [Aspergillus saccharolyticus JOP 1030-1]PYH47685.1 hypothetical protein BP01DRAFT_313665 [Aspergillus saccharolyticus JOP 1030-1]
MARVSGRATSVFARRAPSRNVKKTARKHKVILESVTQEKKKLRSVISFEAKAPPGYTFIPAGNPQLTTACKEVCRKDSLKVFAVSTTPHMHTHNLSQHVHRIGYHFPSAVVARVCMDLGLHLTTTGKAMPFQTVGIDKSRKRANSDASQTTINTEARDVIKDLFPNIPDNDLNQIIKTAFQKGQRKVGTAVELPLARRAQLAVVAHIRHIYTEYDHLLKATSFHEARSVVEEPTLAKLVEWRGDDENGKIVLEDVFREVIVISDDEDSDTEEEAMQSFNRGQSVVVVSSHPRAEELHTNPVTYVASTLREARLDISDEEAPPGFRFVPKIPRNDRLDRRGFSRYQAWDRAINRYRNVTDGANPRKPAGNSPAIQQPLISRRSLQETAGLGSESMFYHVEDRQMLSVPSQMTNDVEISSTAPRRTLANNALDHHLPYALLQATERPYQVNRFSPQSSGPPLDRAQLPQGVNRIIPNDEPANGPVFVSSHRIVSGHPIGQQRRLEHPHSRTISHPEDRALPSIENPFPVEPGRSNCGLVEKLTKRMSGGFAIRSVTPTRLPLREAPRRGIDETVQYQTAKRRRTAVYDLTQTENSRQSFPSAIVGSAHPGEQSALSTYISPGRGSVQENPSLRRNYAAPVVSIYTTDRQPEDKLYPPHTHRVNFREDAIPRRMSFHNIGSAACNTFSSEIPTHYRSPAESRAAPSLRYAIVESRKNEGLAPIQTIGMAENNRGPRVLRRDNNRLRLPEVEETQPDAWSDKNQLYAPASQEMSQRKGHYAEDFVRAIDLSNSEPLEYVPERRLQAIHALDTRPGPGRVDLARGSQHVNQQAEPGLRVLPDLVQANPRGSSTFQRYGVVDDGSQRYRGMQEASISAMRYTDGRYEGAPVLPRDLPELQRYGLRTQEPSYPTYLRESERPRPSIPDGRAIVIVD